MTEQHIYKMINTNLFTDMNTRQQFRNNYAIKEYLNICRYRSQHQKRSHGHRIPQEKQDNPGRKWGEAKNHRRARGSPPAGGGKVHRGAPLPIKSMYEADLAPLFLADWGGGGAPSVRTLCEELQPLQGYSRHIHHKYLKKYNGKK